MGFRLDRTSLLVAVLLVSVQQLHGLQLAPQPQQQGPVEVGVYIESLCPDSRRFVSKQLVASNQVVGNLFVAKIVPFGHARVLANNKMVCQHGQRECDGNRKMACLLARSNNQTQSIETLSCMFDSLDDWRECVKQHMPALAGQLDSIDLCSKGDESYKLMQQAEQLTGKVGYVPHLTLNGKHDEDIQSGLEHRLTKTICSQYKSEPRPEACRAVNTN